MLRHPPRASAAVLALASVLATFSLHAQEDKPKEPVGILFAVGDIAECLNADDKKDLNSKSKKRRERAEAHVKNKSGAATAELIRQQIARAKESFPNVAIRVLALGDLAYDCGATSAFECFHATWGQFETDKILLPVPGNHEYEHKKQEAPNDVCVKKKSEKTKDREHARPYFSYFQSNAFAKAEQGFTLLRFPDEKTGPWLLVGLNPYSKSGGLSATDLKARLDAEKDIRCILAFAHPPFYSSGRHGHADSGDLNAPLAFKGLSQTVFGALHATRVSALVAGHDHHYEQLGRANADGKISDRGASAVDKDSGVRSFVVGTGGTNLYSAKYNTHWAFREAYDLESRGILKIVLYPTSYAWAFIPTNDNSASFKAIKDVKFEDNCNRP